ncbi:MAG: hypothetical protein AAFR96_11825 [Planctomycetota bacterium]
MTTSVRQTIALFVDAYRELAAGKLFWITLILSAAVASAFAAIGIDEQGFTALWFRLDFIPITSDTLPPSALYKFLFFQFGMGIWLTWIATILGLITTAGMVPSLISSGVIDSMVAKPISRTRLFLTRYSTGLLFATLQVLLFSAAAFLVLGLRGGEWLPKVFLAVPIVVVFYSYLFAIMALVGLLTRSTIASLLLTLLIWFVLFLINFADATLVGVDAQSRVRIETLQQTIARGEAEATRRIVQERESAGESVPEGFRPDDEEIGEYNPFVPVLRNRLSDVEDQRAKLQPWVSAAYVVKTVLPKTGETIALLERFVITEEEGQALVRAFSGNDEPEESTVDRESGRVSVSRSESQAEARRVFESRSMLWILGTSLAFEGVVLVLCCVIFGRRDF